MKTKINDYLWSRYSCTFTAANAKITMIGKTYITIRFLFYVLLAYTVAIYKGLIYSTYVGV
jgi:hypothetical protein